MRAFSNYSLENLELELNKCKLLCANCHREYHNPDLSLDKIIESTIKKAKNKKSFSTINNSDSICPVCGKHFPRSKGKIYCSESCRWKAKGYPTIKEINEQYKILKSWEKVAEYFGITRRIIQGIRKRNS